eukprot:scaffold1181_cov67-Cyclotella_meneghiniana.AAC.2
MLVLKRCPLTPAASVVQPPQNTQNIAVRRPRPDLLPSELRLVQGSQKSRKLSEDSLSVTARGGPAASRRIVAPASITDIGTPFTSSDELIVLVRAYCCA